MRRIFVLASFLFATSCAGAVGTLRPPSEGGPDWITVESEHIVLHTDMRQPQALEAIRGFEERYDVLASLLFQGESPPSMRTRVVAFRHREEFLMFTSKSVGAYFRGALDDDGLPTIVMSGVPDARGYSVWQHELAHRFLAAALGSMPAWLNEGLAEYYSTAEANDGRATLGKPLLDTAFILGKWRVEQSNGGYKVYVPVGELVPPSQLTELDRRGFYGDRSVKAEDDSETWRKTTVHYASAWGYVHMLMNGPEVYTARFGDMLMRIAEGEDSQVAYRQSFGDLDPAVLDEAFFDYIRRKETKYWQTDYFAQPPSEPQTQPMPPADVLILWAQLGGFVRAPNTSAGQFLDQAIALAPDDAKVLRYKGVLACQQERWEDCEKQLWAALDQDAENPGTSRLLLSLYDSEYGPWSAEYRQEKLARVSEQLERSAITTSHLNSLAWYLVRNGRAADAESYSHRSIELDPSCWECVDTYARIKFELGDVSAAARYQAVALAKTTERTSPEMIAELTERLDAYRQAAGEDQAAAAKAGTSDERDAVDD